MLSFFLLVCLINGETIQNSTELKYIITYLMSHYSVGGGKNKTALAENTFLNKIFHFRKSSNTTV